MGSELYIFDASNCLFVAQIDEVGRRGEGDGLGKGGAPRGIQGWKSVIYSATFCDSKNI